MGSLRFEKERDERLKRADAEAQARRKLHALESETAKLEQQVQIVLSELERKRAEQAALIREAAEDGVELAQARDENLQWRGADSMAEENPHDV